MLLEETLKVLNSQHDKIKKVILHNVRDTNDPKKIEKLLQKYYDKHTHFSTLDGKRGKLPKLDSLPTIKKKGKRGVHIAFPPIKTSYIDYLIAKKKNSKTNWNTYNTRSRYGKRLAKIVKMTHMALKGAKNIVIDLRGNTGGDLKVFIDAFRRLIPDGVLMFVPGKVVCSKKGRHISFKGKKVKPIKHMDKTKRITILLNKKSMSSSELLTMILRSIHSRCRIVGRSGGYLSLTEDKEFTYEGKHYHINYTITKYIYDRTGKKYYTRGF